MTVASKHASPPALGVATNFYPVPRSDVVVEVAYPKGRALVAIVRHARCGHRLCDVLEHERLVGFAGLGDVPVYERQFLVERACPRCKTQNTRAVTARRGVPVGDSGAWQCEHCGGHLAQVDAPRGRLVLPCPKCRAGQKARVTAAEAFATVMRGAVLLKEARRRIAQQQPTLPADDDDFEDDVPF